MINFKPESFLFSSSERCLSSELKGAENVLTHSIGETGFNRILHDYTPCHDNVIFSLCTPTRPYLHSVKWKTLYNNFGNSCDLVVCSSCGIIPMEYMNCYPYTTYDAYDAYSTTKFRNLYYSVFEKRILTFLDKFGHRWSKKIFVLSPNSVCTKVIRDLELGYLLPSAMVYTDVLKNGSPGVNVARYPLCAEQVLNEISDCLDIPRQIIKKKLF